MLFIFKMKLLDFLFGKKPPIFNKKGHVEHELKGDSWAKWKDRYRYGSEYDWRKHSGMQFKNQTSRKKEE